MSFPYYRPPGGETSVVLYLSPSQMAPLSVPFELQSHISSDSWSYRISAIVKMTTRYSKPRFEALWAVISLMATLIVPLALYQVVFSDGGVLNSKAFALREAEARAVSFGIFAGFAFLFSLPMVLWKLVGQRRMKTMLQHWTDADRISYDYKDALPTWSVRTAGIFRDKATLTITLLNQSNTRTSGFHPNAYLPSYINAPVDADDNYYYPYKPEPGLPRMSTIGNVPLFMDEKGAFKGLNKA